MDLGKLREEYTRDGLSSKDLAKQPIQQFEKWFKQAQEAELPEPNAMVVSTANKNGRINSRTVLLKAFDERGFVFYTNYTSSKAQDIEENAQASICFPWFPLERQIIINGSVEKVSRSDSLKYFLSRPAGSQLGAWVSSQSSVISSRSILLKKLDEMKRKFSEGKIPLPDNWGGFRVIPETIEFWQGRPNRLHDRFQYTRNDNNWQSNRLAP